MAKPQVTLTLAGDHDQLTKSFQEVGEAADKMAGEVADASDDMARSASRADSFSDSVGGIGEKADTAEARIIGVKDTVDGLATVMQGPGEQGLAAYLQGWADLASGVANFIIPATQALLTTGRQTAATIAHTVAQKSAAVASKAFAAAQWLVNAALSANPIGLVILAIAGLVAIIIVAWKRSETFRKIVTGAFNKVLGAVKFVWNWVKKNWPLLLAILTGPIGTAVLVIRRHGDKILGFFRKLPGRIKSAFSGLANILSAPFRQAFSAIRDFWNSTIGGKGFTIPSWVPQIGGRSFRIPRFHTGGVMPGAPGTEGLALLRAGERVIPAGHAGGAQVIEIRVGGNPSGLERMFLSWLQGALRENPGVRLVMS